MAPAESVCYKLRVKLEDISLKYASTYFMACPLEKESGRICEKQVDEEGFCPSCEQEVEPVAKSVLRKGRFSIVSSLEDNGQPLKITVFGANAEKILLSGVAEAMQLERKAIRTGDAKRGGQRKALELLGVFGRVYDMEIVTQKHESKEHEERGTYVTHVPWPVTKELDLF